MSGNKTKRLGSFWERIGKRDDGEKTIVSTSDAPELDEPDRPYGFAQLAGRLTERGILGQGGMSIVYRVFDADLGREMALKCMRPEFAEDRNLIRRFIEEAQITGQLDHPAIPPVHGLGLNNDGRYCFTMRQVRGRTLLDVICESAYEPEDPDLLFDVLDVFVQVCRAVSYAHEKGVVHCDLKPPNVMIGAHGEVYLTDWGIARLNEPRASGADREAAHIVLEKEQIAMGTSDLVGTPGYMAPEQARSDHDAIAEHTDIFGLGALLYQLLTLQPPYMGANVQETLTRAANAQITHPRDLRADLPPRICEIAMKAMNRAPEDRYRTVEALRLDVEAFRRGEGMFERCDVTEGSVLIKEGDPPGNAYIIIDGQFSVEKRGAHVRMLNRGDVFGEMAVFSGQPRAASVRAVRDSTVAVVPADSLDERMAENNTTLSRFVRALARTAKEIDGELVKMKRDWSHSNLFQEVLLFMAFNAEADGPHTRKASWAALVERMVPGFAPNAETLSDMLAPFAALEVDVERGQVVLRSL